MLIKSFPIHLITISVIQSLWSHFFPLNHVVAALQHVHTSGGVSGLSAAEHAMGPLGSELHMQSDEGNFTSPI